MGWINEQRDSVNWQSHLGIPPGARVEFIVQGPPDGETGLLVTRTVDTGPGGENDTNRMLAKIVATPDAPEPRSKLQSSPQPLPPPREEWLGDVAPVRVRRLYFSEKLADPNDPTSAVEFYLTVDGQTPKMFDMNSTVPEHRGPAGNGGGLDHRKPIERTARIPHSSTAFSAARLHGHAGEREFSARHGQCALLQRHGCLPIPAFACAWIFAIPIPLERFLIIAICWNTKTRE